MHVGGYYIYPLAVYVALGVGVLVAAALRWFKLSWVTSALIALVPALLAYAATWYLGAFGAAMSQTG
jgi:hypothetical protein